MTDRYITVRCKTRLDRSDLPRGQRGCDQIVIRTLGIYGPLAPRIRLFDYGRMYFACGHQDDKANNALAQGIEESFKGGAW